MRKYVEFAIFFIAMALASDFAFSLPQLCGQFGGADAYIYYTAKVVCIIFAIIIGYLKLTERKK